MRNEGCGCLPEPSPVTVSLDGETYRIPGSFIHPGGNQVLSAVDGRDISSLFRGKNGGHAHSEAAWKMLQGYRGSSLANAVGPERLENREPIDNGAPIIAQLSSLDAASYHAWVHRPVPDHPVFFATPWMENITKVKWWVVPLIWIPVAIAWFAWGGRELGGVHALLAALCGALSWQAMEYSLHRWVFHARPSGHWAICVHFLMHGCHHKFPQDIERLVFPPLPAAAIAAVIYSIICLLLPKCVADPFFAGVLLGYVRYDVMHYLMHAGRLGGSLKRAHMRHHYQEPNAIFGISGAGMDWLLGTDGNSFRNIGLTQPQAGGPANVPMPVLARVDISLTPHRKVN